jgi:hypothetical protein
MSDKLDYKPNLPSDKEYLTGVAKSITEREPLEKIQFEYLTDTLQALDITENPYDLVSKENLNPEALKALVDESFSHIQSGEITLELKEKLSRLWDYLAEEDPLEKANLIFVFGGPGIQRVNEAVSLYKKGYASRILFTGQKASYMERVDVTEAEHYGNLAREQGVSEGDIILETGAKNTPENATKSVAILKASGQLPERIILITLPYHMRRSYLTFKSVADWHPKLIRRVIPSAKYTRENYFADKNGWSYVFFEYMKLWGARLMRHF